MLEVKILAENHAYRKGILAEHGLSMLVTIDVDGTCFALLPLGRFVTHHKKTFTPLSIYTMKKLEVVNRRIFSASNQIS